MLVKKNKTCIVCNKKYTFCTGCAEFDRFPRWMAIYHDENCKKIFETASDFLAGEISQQVAKEQFDKCDLSGKESFHYKIQEAINLVYKDYVQNDSEDSQPVTDNAEGIMLAATNETTAENRPSYTKMARNKKRK